VTSDLEDGRTNLLDATRTGGALATVVYGRLSLRLPALHAA
jgi:hypothetical protein